jgi:Zn-dependent protease
LPLPPNSAISHAAMSRFYDIDSTRVSHREYWWGTRSPLVLVGWLTKWLRIRLPSSTDDPNVDSTLPFVRESLPPEIADRFEPLTARLTELGFHRPVYYAIEDAGTQTTVYWATFLHSTGLHFARLHHRLWNKSKTVSRALFPLFFTEFADGTFLVSSSGKPDLAAPESVTMNRMPGAAPADLWAAHERQAELSSRQKNIAKVRTPEDLVAASERLHVLLRDFHLGRGVFRERTADEQAKADAFAGRVQEARAQGLEHGEVLAELDRMQDQKPGWSSTVWILVISLVAFLVAGAARWNWKFTLLIVPVLLFHEAGHWVAMRVFRYRNLRMFFIPLFGAAVMGRNWNVPGWKKALVSLAGPLPGIALGVVLGVLGMLLKRPWLTETSLILLLVNGFNLLPILPLDGGHVLHATLFCRNRWLDILFRLLAIISLVLLGIVGHFKLLAYIAIPLAIALPIAFKMGQVADRLRRQSLPAPLPDEDRIPAPTAQAIISAVKEALPKGANNKTLAMHSLSVFETLNARPPGILATLSLLFLQGGAVVVTLLFGVLLILNQHGGIGDFISAAARQPRHAVACEQLAAWKPSAVNAASNNPHNTLVATFAHRAEAEQAFGELTNRVPAPTGALLFGDSLLLTLPAADDAAREEWFHELQTRSTNVFVAVSNSPVAVSLTFLAPTEIIASNLQQEIEEYFIMNGVFHLAAPWSPAAQQPGFEARRQARRDWNRIGQATSAVWRDPAVLAYSKKIDAAFRRGASAEVERLSREQQQLTRTLRAAILARLRNGGPAGVDPVLVDWFEQLGKPDLTNQAERAALERQVAGRLGEVAYEGDHPAPRAEAWGARSGLIAKHGLLLAIHWAAFNDPCVGLPAFASWLCQQDCRRIQYDFDGAVPFGLLDEEE